MTFVKSNAFWKLDFEKDYPKAGATGGFIHYCEYPVLQQNPKALEAVWGLCLWQSWLFWVQIHLLTNVINAILKVISNLPNADLGVQTAAITDPKTVDFEVKT